MRAIRRMIEERAQDTFEYLLVVAIVAVPFIVALIVALETIVPDVLGHSCQSVDTAAAPPATDGSCLSP